MNHCKITNLNGARYIKTLEKAARDPRVAEIEGGGCEYGRVFIDLQPGWRFAWLQCRSKTVGNSGDVRDLLRQIERRP